MIKTLYPIFQRWSVGGSVYLIADTHFNDTDRDFMGYNIAETEQAYILYNTCHKNDTLIHLGDVGNPEWLKGLKCYKVLIMGNHDKADVKEYFDEVYTGPLWISQKLVLSHEPIDMKFAGAYEEVPNIAFNIHGHDHNNTFIDTDHLNLAQNIYGYVPLNLNQFIKSGRLKNIDDIHRITIDNAIRNNFIDKIKQHYFFINGV